jgi:hypothetical protein
MITLAPDDTVVVRINLIFAVVKIYTSIRHTDSREVIVYLNIWFGNDTTMTTYMDDI